MSKFQLFQNLKKFKHLVVSEFEKIQKFHKKFHKFRKI